MMMRKKEKQQCLLPLFSHKQDQVQAPKSYIKPSVFQFPQLLQKSTKNNTKRLLNQIPIAITPDPRVEFGKKELLQKYKIANKVQRNSARVLVKPDKPKTRIQSNLSQIIQSEDSLYQLSELDLCDDQVKGIQRKLQTPGDKNIIALAGEIMILDAMDIRELQNQQRIMNLMLTQTIEQQITSKEINSVIFIILEEALIRDDLEIDPRIEVFLKIPNENLDYLSAKHISRIGQLVPFIKYDKVIQLSRYLQILLRILWHSPNNFTFELGLNQLLRSTLIRQRITAITDAPTTAMQLAIANQFRLFKV